MIWPGRSSWAKTLGPSSSSLPNAERKLADRASPSPSSAEVSLPSSALSTSGAAETITVGITSDDFECGESDSGDEALAGAGGIFDRLKSSPASARIDDGDVGLRDVDRLSIEPSSDE